MNKRLIFATVVGAAGAIALARRFSLHEDLEWEDIEKPGSVVDIDGYAVHYVERGSGTPIVLVHGFGGSTFHFRRQIDALAEAGHRVIAVDLKGFGYSERNAHAGLSGTDQAMMLASLLTKLGVEHATFVGHSMGGAIVQRFAAMYPERVDALVLAAPATGDERRASLPSFVLRPVISLLAAFASNRLLQLSFYDDSKITGELREEYLRPGRIKGSMDGLLAMMRDGAGDGEIDTSRITQPSLLLWGAEDRVMPLSLMKRIRERIPQAREVVIDRAGHALFEEQPGDVNRAIRDFVEESASTPPRQATTTR